jgi:hypothetical protein
MKLMSHEMAVDPTAKSPTWLTTFSFWPKKQKKTAPSLFIYYYIKNYYHFFFFFAKTS